MGEQRGPNAFYSEPYAAITWLGKKARSTANFELLVQSAYLRRLVFEVVHPDEEPPHLTWTVDWAVAADGRLVLWNGGQADKP
jgi:hypothetical protein